MKKSSSFLKLTIPEPCNEGWDNMSPTDNGRHCHSCSRELIDFTKWSDSRLVEYLQNNHGKLCGHFSSRQLNRNLLPAMQTAPSYSGLSLPALVLLAITMTSGAALAADHPDPAPHFSLVSLAENAPKDTLRPTYTFPGLVFDKNTREPLPFVHIVVSADSVQLFETQTDIDGLFDLEIPADITTFQFTLFYVGYESVTLTGDAAHTGTRNLYQMWGDEEVVLDGMIITVSKEEIKRSRRANRKAEREMRRENTKTD
jgi:hypothetical protein